MDFPIPGSPPKRITEPGTIPPPKVLSISVICVGNLFSPATSISDNLTAFLTLVPVDNKTEAGYSLLEAFISSIVFHSPQRGQRPNHCRDSAPHSLHINFTICFFAHIDNSL